MMRSHKEFEMLCALAAVEQLSEMDRKDLNNHCLFCEYCRRSLTETEAVSQEYFLLFASRSERTTALPSGAHDRFLRRASSLGIPLSAVSPGNFTNHVAHLPIGVFVVAVVALFLCRSLIRPHDFPRDIPSNDLSSTRNIQPVPLNLTTARAPVSLIVRKHRHTAERLTLQVSHVRYRTHFRFSSQLNLMHDIATSKEPPVFKLSYPVDWGTLRPTQGKIFALTSLPQLWPEDDAASRDKHIAHFDLPTLFPKTSSKTQ